MQSFDGGIALSVAFLCASLVFILWFVCRAIDEYFSRRETVLEDMRRFGHAFIREFERPLVQPPFVESPLRARLKPRPDSGRLDVFLAPNGLNRYPNLSDHRENLTYDVARVLHKLCDDSFEGGELSARGQWVVVSFQHQRQAGRSFNGAHPPADR
jgi:hypothetical protein